MRVLLLPLAVLSLVPLVAGQDQDAPHLAPDHSVLYGHGTGDDEASGFMNTLEQDGNDNALGPSSSCAPYEGVDLLADDVSRTYTFTLDPELTRAVTLAPSEITATAHIGASSCDGDEVEVTSTLVQGETTIASSESVTHTWEAGAPYPAVELPMAIAETALVPGDDIIWTLQISGTYYGMLFLGMSAEQGRTRMDLPVESVASDAVTLYHDVGTEDLTISMDLSNTTARHVYNWTHGPASAVIFGQGNITGGEVALRAVDAANETAYEATLSGHVNVTEQLQAAAGNWTIHVNATAATGNVTLLFGPPVPSGGDGGGDGDGNGDGDGDGNGDGDGDSDGNMTDEDGEDSPAAPWLLVALAALVAAAARRRR